MNMQVSPETVAREHVMEIMDPTGHTTVTWNPDSEASIADARREFNRLKRLGYSAFPMNVVMENGVVVEEKDNQRMDEFDPSVGRVMMIPQLIGG